MSRALKNKPYETEQKARKKTKKKTDEREEFH